MRFIKFNTILRFLYFVIRKFSSLTFVADCHSEMYSLDAVSFAKQSFDENVLVKHSKKHLWAMHNTETLL
jgi:hypothetical protein